MSYRKNRPCSLAIVPRETTPIFFIEDHQKKYERLRKFEKDKLITKYMDLDDAHNKLMMDYALSCTIIERKKTYIAKLEKRLNLIHSSSSREYYDKF